MKCFSLVAGRMEYNPVFSKTAQGGAKKMCDSKWLVPNTKRPEFCPVRLYYMLISKRSTNIKTDRLFLTPNPTWNTPQTLGWFKNIPVGRNKLSKWTKEAAVRTGLNTKDKKITNHSLRATAVSNLAKAGIEEQQLIKITGHNRAGSIKPYLQMDSNHHSTIINALRNGSKEPEASSSQGQINQNTTTAATSSEDDVHLSEVSSIIKNHNNISNNTPVVYNNCKFYNNCNFSNSTQ